MIRNDCGLLVDDATCPPMTVGYVICHEGKAWSPDGRVEVSEEVAKKHNSLLAKMEWGAMLRTGKGILYVTKEEVPSSWAKGKAYRYFMSQWNGDRKRSIEPPSYSFHNMAGKDGRRDFHFILDGHWWHGVNIGDNQMLRVKRTKERI